MAFRQARERAGITLTQAAKEIGVSKAALSIWENEKGLPLVENLLKLAKLYGCTADDLLRPDGNFVPAPLLEERRDIGGETGVQAESGKAE